MNKNNKYTLGSNYILRQNSPNSFGLFDTVRSKKYEINAELYFFLKLFKYSLTTKESAYMYFLQNNIKINREKFDQFLKQEEFTDLLVSSTIPYADIEDYPLNKEFPLFVQNTPQRVDLILTEKCNLECKHCFQESSPQKEGFFPPLNKLKILFDELEKLNIRNLKISGGEPLLYPQIDKLLEYLCEKKFQKSILTNAILLNDKLIDIIKSHHFKFGISLDGATEKTHEFLRGKHTFERTINNILKLKKNNIHFSITTTIYKENKNTIEDIANLVFNKLGGTNLNFNLLMSLGRGQSNFELSIFRNEIEELKEKIKKIALKYPHNVIVINDQNELLEKENKTDIIYCTGGTEYLAINNLLEVYPCTYGFGMQEFKMGTFGEESIMDIWKNEKWHLFRGGVRLQDLEECSDCKLKFRCTNKSCRLKPVYQGNDFYSACRPCNKLEL